MVPGFNTDVKWQCRVYHVQTEDIGGQHQVESLIFVGGEILAAKRTSYLDQAAPLSPAEIAAFLHHQHEVILSVIKAGLIEELNQRETIKDLERLVGFNGHFGQEAPPKPAPVAATPPTNGPKPAKKVAREVKPKSIGPLDLMAEVFGSLSPRKPTARLGEERQRLAKDEPIDEVQVHSNGSNGQPALEPDSMARPGDEIEGEAPHEQDASQNGDQVAAPEKEQTIEFSTPVEPQIRMQLYGKEEFFAGDCGPVMIVIKGRETPFPIKNAEVTLKLVGSSFRPMLWRSITGGNGLAAFDVAIPNFTSGTAIFMISVAAAEGELHERIPVRRHASNLVGTL